MITVIKDVEVYSPKYIGRKQVLIVGNRFEGIYDEISIPTNFIHINEVDGSGKLIFPGFIDNHVHIIGAGGEEGFSTRTSEIKFSELTTSGITTAIGCLGTDGVCRDMESLIAKARSLEEDGISAYCYTGSYQVPVVTVTNSIKEDLMLIDKVIGVGEIALSDHRSSQPTFEEFVKVAAEARVGGLLSGKSGIVDIHMGVGNRRLEKVFLLLENTEIPPTQLLPTHINRSRELFEEGIEYLKKGGYIDLTTSSDPDYLEPGELIASKGLKRIYDLGLPIEQVTFSSDGQGSMPKYNENDEFMGIGICSVKSLYCEVRKAILEEGMPIEKTIVVITSNVAKLFKLKDVGEIKAGYFADFVLVNKDDLKICDVYAKGKILVKDEKAIVKNVFE
ncbi:MULTISPECIES: beta-aspartyl-peptidase [Clostridium]|uniref:Isoaspartyl dipeptidase n=1 Tax=Clostridium cibarium TaxID=2762247 RepID=A0ABR8PYN9_9CLOT|nr:MULTISPECIES: beta-aspartyl-peptidase [Clostridium]MBD7913276.1 beta-aspartyl-peptidase [Clostridium cibarium]